MWSCDASLKHSGHQCFGGYAIFWEMQCFHILPRCCGLVWQKTGCFPLPTRKRIKPILDAAIFELPWSVASLLRFAGCIPDHISTYENTGVLHYHNAKILVIPLVNTSTPQVRVGHSVFHWTVWTPS
jgi:hypothetical protein